MCCTRLAENTGRKKSPKIRHLGAIAQFCRVVSSQLRHVSTIEKKLLTSNISSMCSHNMASCLRYCSDVAQRRPTILCTMFGRLLDWYTIHFGGSCPVTEFCPVQNSLCVQVLRSPILAALLHSTPAAGVSQTLRRGTRNGITEYRTFAEGAT